MLTFILVLFAMFLFWLFGHLLGFLIYLLILFAGHLYSYWFIYVPLLVIVGLCIWLGVTNLIVILSLTAIVLGLCTLLVVIKERNHEHV